MKWISLRGLIHLAPPHRICGGDSGTDCSFQSSLMPSSEMMGNTQSEGVAVYERAPNLRVGGMGDE